MRDDHAELVRALRDLLPREVGIGAADAGHEHQLLPGEILAAATVPARLREFAGGRAAARRALADIGHPPVAIPRANDRAPLWPAGVTGSIAHAGSVCLAVAARRTAWRAVGIDLEPTQPLDVGLWRHVLIDAERSFLGAQPTQRQGLLALTIFAAKEAAFKAQYQITNVMLDFTMIRVDLRADTFQAWLPSDLAPTVANRPIMGRHRQIGSHVVCVAMVPRVAGADPAQPTGETDQQTPTVTGRAFGPAHPWITQAQPGPSGRCCRNSMPDQPVKLRTRAATPTPDRCRRLVGALGVAPA